ncbi:Hsp20/alpha crystallin family protein [Fodinibius sp. Rm-B-1B1-1]|uniref:Hsp20/alpha crystallin family protein n=1 Tax=Fodinibius alkaliphilus TaxID=3140241 RepID=UPI003159BC8E
MKQLTRYQPSAAPVSNLRREMDRIFNELIPFSWRLDEPETGMSMWTPITDMMETDNEYLLEVELPGLTKKDIQINCQDNVLSVEGERKHDKKEERPGYLRSERSYGAFKRSIILPTSILEDKVKATFKDGILKITVPKAEKSKRKTVPIE